MRNPFKRQMPKNNYRRRSGTEIRAENRARNRVIFNPHWRLKATGRPIGPYVRRLHGPIGSELERANAANR